MLNLNLIVAGGVWSAALAAAVALAISLHPDAVTKIALPTSLFTGILGLIVGGGDASLQYAYLYVGSFLNDVAPGALTTKVGVISRLTDMLYGFNTVAVALTGVFFCAVFALWIGTARVRTKQA